MIPSETGQANIELHVALCLGCGSNKIKIFDKCRETFNQGGGECRRCGRHSMGECSTYPSKEDLPAIWNMNNDIQMLIAVQQAIIDKAQAEIDALLLRKAGRE